MDNDNVFESANFEICIHQVLCTIKIMYDTIEISKLLGEHDPFDIRSKGEFRAIKKLYRSIYRPYMPAAHVDEAVRRAMELYKEESA